MELRCYFCDEIDNISFCGRCCKPVCPSHRWGTGSISDGYYCHECSGGALGQLFPYKQELPRERTIYQKINDLPPMMLVFAAILLGVAAVLLGNYIRMR